VLVLANQRLVASIAKKYIGLSDLDLLDLISEGNIGLAKGVRRMIPRLGNRLSTVAIWWLKQNMTRMMRQTGHAITLPDNLQTAVHAFKKAEAALEQQSGDSPNDEEVAGATGKDAGKIKQLRALADIVVFSLNTPAEGEDSEVGDFMPDERADPAERLDALSAALWVEEVLEIELRPDEREMVRRRFGIGNEDGRPMSLRELGKHAGVSGELIRLRLAKALAAIRECNQDPDSLAD
jgi:RNA polymerase primary sigma factor